MTENQISLGGVEDLGHKCDWRMERGGISENFLEGKLPYSGSHFSHSG